MWCKIFAIFWQILRNRLILDDMRWFVCRFRPIFTHHLCTGWAGSAVCFYQLQFWHKLFTSTVQCLASCVWFAGSNYSTNTCQWLVHLKLINFDIWFTMDGCVINVRFVFKRVHCTFNEAAFLNPRAVWCYNNGGWVGRLVAVGEVVSTAASPSGRSMQRCDMYSVGVPLRVAHPPCG